MTKKHLMLEKSVMFIFVFLLIVGCGKKTTKISGDMLPSESFKTFIGSVQFDTNLSSLSTYKIVDGNKKVFIYERIGTTAMDVNDWEAKFTETLIFQIDTSQVEFTYCDSVLKYINCKYFWVCLTKEFKKEIRNIDEGCIKGKISKEDYSIEIDVNPEFYFGGHQDSQKERKIKYNTARR